jgi:hypothetical protein
MIHSWLVVHTAPGNAEEHSLAGKTDEWVILFNQINPLAMRQGAIFFSTKRVRCRVGQ